MNELQEAEAFSKELDQLLSGKHEGPRTKDLDLAAMLGRCDYAADSRVRRSLKAKLLEQPIPAPRRWFQSPAVRWGAAFACAGLAMIVVIPAYYMPGFQMASLDGEIGGSGGSSPYNGQPRSAPSHLFSDPAGRSSYLSSPISGGGSAQMRPMEMASFRKLFRENRGARSSAAAGRSYDGQGAMSSLAPGSLLGGGESSVIEPLNVRDPSTLIMGQDKKGPPSPAPTGAETEDNFNTEGYSHIIENPFQKAADEPLSTFSIDVDAASYANVRRFLNESRLPPKDAVRVEEFINYFRYSYPQPEKGKPFSITTEQAAAPWAPKHKLVRIGLQGRRLPMEALPANNLVFMVDSSGSMASPDKLPLLKSSFRLLVDQLRGKDRISIVAYAGAAGLVLPPTRGDDKGAILEALDRLEAGGSTAGGQGIQLAYQTAANGFLKSGNNRVILATDGDFNVGLSSEGELVRLIEEERKKGIFLTVLGFGRGNYQDSKMEKLADTGNGNYAYVDDILEARKVLVQELGATLLTLAKDVKLQIEFNPARVQAYRLIGYENRMLAAEDFNDDKKDAGELGAGHSVTALYEIIPVGVKADLREVDPLKYQKTAPVESAGESKDLLTVKFRYKDPDGEKSKLIERPLADADQAWDAASEDFRFAAAAAGFAMKLRGSEHIGDFGYAEFQEMARGAVGKDEGAYRSEMVRLIEKARLLQK